MKTVIVGGGRAGRELAVQVRGRVIIIERDAERCKELANLKNVDVILGDGSDEEVLSRVDLDDVSAFIALTGDDDVNYRAAKIARMHGVPRIMVRVENPENIERFKELGVEYVTSPTTAVANLFAGLIQHPQKREEHQSERREGREGHQKREEKRKERQKREERQSEERQEESEIGVPFRRILVPIINERAVDRAFKEALLIASVSRAEVAVILSEDMECERCKMESAAIKLGVPLRIIVEREKLTDIVRKHLHYPSCVILEHVKKHFYHPDCIIIDKEKLGFLDRFMNRSIVFRAIKYAGCPVLVARTFRYYERILAILDSSEVSRKVGMYAVQMAHICGAELHLLVLEDMRNDMNEIKRLGERGNVRMVEKRVEGNPMIETVKEVRSGNYELAVISWRGAGVIRADMIRKIINNAPCSVLTVV